MQIRAIIEIKSTNRDFNGNVYRAARIISTRTGKATEWFDCVSDGNAVHVICDLLDCSPRQVWRDNNYTGSARLSSLPEHRYGDRETIAAALRGIGFAVPAARVDKATGCF